MNCVAGRSSAGTLMGGGGLLEKVEERKFFFILRAIKVLLKPLTTVYGLKL